MESNLSQVYQMAINNCAATLARSNDAKTKLLHLSPRATKKRAELETDITSLNAFDLSAALAVAFAKRKEDVIADIIQAQSKAAEMLEETR